MPFFKLFLPGIALFAVVSLCPKAATAQGERIGQQEFLAAYKPFAESIRQRLGNAKGKFTQVVPLTGLGKVSYREQLFSQHDTLYSGLVTYKLREKSGEMIDVPDRSAYGRNGDYSFEIESEKPGEWKIKRLLRLPDGARDLQLITTSAYAENMLGRTYFELISSDSCRFLSATRGSENGRPILEVKFQIPNENTPNQKGKSSPTEYLLRFDADSWVCLLQQKTDTQDSAKKASAQTIYTYRSDSSGNIIPKSIEIRSIKPDGSFGGEPEVSYDIAEWEALPADAKLANTLPDYGLPEPFPKPEQYARLYWIFAAALALGILGAAFAVYGKRHRSRMTGNS